MMMIRADALPNPGDIVLMEFGPVRGTEQDATRPALVISVRGMHEISRRAIICPITRNTRPWPTKVLLPEGLVAQGAVLVDQVRSIDRSARILRRLGQVPDEIVLLVRRKLAALTGIEFQVSGAERT
jgi:mRNA interferase MazF